MSAAIKILPEFAHSPVTYVMQSVPVHCGCTDLLKPETSVLPLTFAA